MNAPLLRLTCTALLGLGMAACKPTPPPTDEPPQPQAVAAPEATELRDARKGKSGAAKSRLRGWFIGQWCPVVWLPPTLTESAAVCALRQSLHRSGLLLSRGQATRIHDAALKLTVMLSNESIFALHSPKN